MILKKEEINTTQKYPVKTKIGLPHALLYSRYHILWSSFFSSLGMEIIESGPTNKEILLSGSNTAIDETCLSAKLYLGHVQSLIGACDYVLVPRISNLGRQQNMCTRFESIYDLVCGTYRNSEQNFLCYNVDVLHKYTEENAFLSMGADLGFCKKDVKEAYKKAKKEEEEHLRRQLTAEEALYKKTGTKIMIAAHSYIIEDEYLGKPIMNYLKELGTIPIRAYIADQKETLKQSLKVSPTMKWEWSREITGNIYIHRNQIDGILLISAFPCGPDSMVNEIISRKFSPIPVLSLVLDSQSGMAGIETRLESFVDILRFKEGKS
ncbi:MAG: acyl-CoA dehydratase activase-related protein [Agathobacter sp.]